MSEEELVKKAEVISAVRGYEKKRVQRKDRTVDFTVSLPGSDDETLIRVITEPKSKSGYVIVDTVSEMTEDLKEEDYDDGIIIGKRFTKAAKRDMRQENVEVVSERVKPHFKSERLYSVINSCIEGLCKAKCGQVPEKESDCKGHTDGHYSCDVRLISDNASFHFDLGWVDFLERDLARLLVIQKDLNN